MSITIYPSQFNMREDGGYEQLPAIKGETGEQGVPGVGALPGGTKGQVPVKQSADDYDVAWETPLALSVEWYAFDNWSISANNQAYQDFDVSSKVGNKTLLGVVGVDQWNASSSGTNSDKCVLRRFIALDNTTVRVAFRNTGSSAAKIGGTISLLLCS